MFITQYAENSQAGVTMLIEIGTFYDENQKIWSGPKRKDFFGPEMTIGEVALHVLSKMPEKIIQVMDGTGEELTAGALVRDAKAVATNLQRLGLKVGDVIGISANNTTNLAAVLLGALLCGTPTNALYPGFEKESVELVFKVTTPKLIFCDAENFKTIRAAVTSIKLVAEIIIVDGEIEGVRNVKDLFKTTDEDVALYSNFPCHALTGDDTAVIVCSSGTTGPPKGVCCSHKSLLNQLVIPNLPASAVIYCGSTMYWISGVWVFVMNIVTGAKRIISNLPFSAEYLLQLIEKHKITHLVSTPYEMAAILQYAAPDITSRLDSIDAIFCGGSKVSKTITENIKALLGEKPRTGFIVAYGMTELSGMLSNNVKGRIGTEGKLRANMEVRILSKTGKFLGVNEMGLITIRMPYKWAGYYRKPEATKETLLDDWFLSSDIGYFDEEYNLSVCTRDSDIFKYNNFQIYPGLVEEAVMEVTGVMEACVFGIPDLAASNLVACAVVRANNEDGYKLTEESIIEYVANKMAHMNHIKGGLYFVKQLPKTVSGKLLRRKVWEMIQNGK